MLVILCVALLLSAASPSFAQQTDVEQIHLAYVPDGMTVSFYTQSALGSVPSVSYGTSPNSLDGSASGTSSTYDGAGYFHHVVINGLSPFSPYYYKIDQDSTNTVRTFTTARAAGDNRTFSFFLIGDMGVDNSAATMVQLNSGINTTEFVLHIGDISYADDFYLRGDTYEGTWNSYMNEMQSVTDQKAYMVLPGNHESTCSEATPFLCPEQEKNFTAYLHRFRMPFAESGATNNMWYSFDYGMVHFVQISTETDFPSAPEGEGSWMSSGPFGPQLTWLQNDLAAASAPDRRQQVPWIIVSGHRPLYSSGGGCDSCLAAFESMFNQYNVDIFFAGHVHWYERMYAIAPGTKVVSTDYINPTAPVYIVNGAAGNVEGHASGTQQSYTAFLDNGDYGYSYVTVHNSSHLDFGFYRSSDGSLVDHVTIVQTKH